jgi:hypothetical protein
MMLTGVFDEKVMRVAGEINVFTDTSALKRLNALGIFKANVNSLLVSRNTGDDVSYKITDVCDVSMM